MQHIQRWIPLLAVVISSVSGVSTVAQTPIGELRREASTTIAGTVRSVVGNEFILDDGSSQIIVDAGPVWYHQISIREGERLTVVGEYDDYDFDAFRITRSNGEVITIRNGPGRPPWAGGRDRPR